MISVGGNTTALIQVKDNKWVWNPFNLKTCVIQSQQDEKKIDATSENARMIINGSVYHILMIDDPVGMHQHLEIMLQYVGGGLGV